MAGAACVCLQFGLFLLEKTDVAEIGASRRFGRKGLTFHQMVKVNNDAVLKSTLAPPPSGVSAWGSAFCSLHHRTFALKVYGCGLTV